jgi:hypothetical protein
MGISAEEFNRLITEIFDQEKQDEQLHHHQQQQVDQPMEEAQDEQSQQMQSMEQPQMEQEFLPEDDDQLHQPTLDVQESEEERMQKAASDASTRTPVISTPVPDIQQPPPRETLRTREQRAAAQPSSAIDSQAPPSSFFDASGWPSPPPLNFTINPPHCSCGHTYADEEKLKKHAATCKRLARAMERIHSKGKKPKAEVRKTEET